MERCDEAVMFQSRIDGNEAGAELNCNQYRYCSKQNHIRWECPSYLEGKPPAERPPGMSTARKLSSSPQNGRGDEKKERSRAFMTMSVVVEDQEVFEKYRGAFVFTSAYRHTQVSVPCDSGANFCINL